MTTDVTAEKSESVNSSFKSESLVDQSDDDLDNMKLRISDDEATNKHGVSFEEGGPAPSKDKMEDRPSSDSATEERTEKSKEAESEVAVVDPVPEEHVVNGVSDVESENADGEKAGNDKADCVKAGNDKVDGEKAGNKAEAGSAENDSDEKKIETPPEGTAEEVKDAPDETKDAVKSDENVDETKDAVKSDENVDETKDAVKSDENAYEVAKTDPTSIEIEEKTALQEILGDGSKLTEASSSSGPSSVARTASLESDAAPGLTEPMDEDSSNFANFIADVAQKLSKDTKKRRRSLDSENEFESTESGNKKMRVEKRHCSDGEQETEVGVSVSPAKERRRSYSESDMIKDLEKFNSKQSSAESLKGDKWKPPELTEEEKKHLEQTNAREKKMRENVLRVIQRNYKTMAVEDFEDAIYVAIMDYFCHYNSSALLQRKVLMLEKLVSRLQENYNRTFKQFCEAKYLLRRMVEIRKEDAKKCVCKDKVPFKLIRSVAVQVQTARCRGGELCPGSSVGLDPNFKAGGANTSKPNTPRKTVDQDQSTATKDDKAPVPNSSFSNAKGSALAPSSTAANQSSGPRPISVSVPPTIPLRTLLTHQKSAGELQNGKTVMAVQAQAQRTLRSAPQPSPSQPPRSIEPAPARQHLVIDLTDKDEDIVSTPHQQPPAPPANAIQQPAKQVSVQQPIQTRVVKTSVLSPMPKLPPLPPAPLYKAVVRRPPQPVLKVCKADQSGIMLSWTLRTSIPLANEIIFYQVYACQENAGVTREWSTVGDVKALPLPMACTLSQFREGHRYHFVVRAVDKFKVLGEFSHPASILLVSKNGTANHSVAPAGTTNRR